MNNKAFNISGDCWLPIRECPKDMGALYLLGGKIGELDEYTVAYWYGFRNVWRVCGTDKPPIFEPEVYIPINRYC